MEVNVFLRVSSTAQSEAMAGLRVAMVADEEGLAAMQKGEVLFTQNTSRQQAVTPMFLGRLAKDEVG